MGEGIILPEQGHNPERPLPAHEKIINLPDKRILIIGTNHGIASSTRYRAVPFPGRLHTEQEILDSFGQTGPDAFVIDSMTDINDGKHQGDVIFLNTIKERLTPIKNDANLSFQEWGVKQGISGKTLILADPFNMVPYFSDFSLYDLGFFNTRDEKKSAEIISDVAALSLLGLTIAYGLAIRPKLTRRAFIFGGAVATIAAPLLIREFLREQLKTLFRRKKIIGKDDVDAVQAVFGEPRQLTDQDYTKPEFQTYAAYTESLKYLIVFRNSMIAEVLSLPSSELHLQTNENHNKADVAIVMGSGHLISKKHSISYFLENEKARRDILEELLKGVFKGIESINDEFREDVPVDVDKLKAAFRNYPRSYKIDKNGDATSLSIRVPYIEAILDRLPK